MTGDIKRFEIVRDLIFKFRIILITIIVENPLPSYVIIVLVKLVAVIYKVISGGIQKSRGDFNLPITFILMITLDFTPLRVDESSVFDNFIRD